MVPKVKTGSREDIITFKGEDIMTAAGVLAAIVAGTATATGAEETPVPTGATPAEEAPPVKASSSTCVP